MFYGHIFGKISTKFRSILCVFANFGAPLPREISEALTVSCVIYIIQRATKNLHLVAILLQLIAKRQPEDFRILSPESQSKLRDLNEK